jgi:hypothetical protein
MKGLAANGDELFFAGDFSRGAQHVVKLTLLRFYLLAVKPVLRQNAV